MKWYFASRVRHTESLIKISKFLVSQGEEITSTWVYGKSLKPYHEHIEEVQKVGTENTACILKSDIFVLISDPEGTDMFVELGIALASNARIYIVGEYGKRSLMQLHPRIIHAENLKKVFEQEHISTDHFEELTLDF